MSEEVEIWGELTSSDFQKKLQLFTQQFGSPTKQRRLALQADNFKRHDLDTRIRITNGTAEIVQKVGPWEAKSRTEIHVPLKLSSNGIVQLYQLLINQLPPDFRQTNIIQYSNNIFELPECELKLGEQTGKETVYHYELEAKTPSVNLELKRHELGLPEALMDSNEAFWTEWNERVNLSANNLSYRQLLEVVEQYL